MGQLIVAAAGAALGAATFGAAPILFGMTGSSLGWAAGSLLGGALFGPTQKSQGPRLGDLSVGGSSYGTPIPYVQGHPRISGQIVWASAKREIASTQSQGKGGGGSEYTSYTYEVDLLILLADNPIVGVARIWKNGELVSNILSDAAAATLGASSATALWDRLTVYTGDAAQLPDPTYEAAVGTDNAPAYRGRGSVFIEGLQLGSSGQLPNLTFEIGTAGAVTPYSSDLFHAPLTANFSDTVSPAASLSGPTGAHAYSFATSDLVVTMSAGDTLSAYWTATKINGNDATLLGQRFTVQAVVILPSSVQSTDVSRFFGYGSGTDAEQFAYRKDSGSGQMRLYAHVSHDWGDTTEDLGAMPTGVNTYKLVYESDNYTTHWYTAVGESDPLDWVLVYTSYRARYAGIISIAAPNPGYPDSGGATTITFRDVAAWGGIGRYTSDLFTVADVPLSDVVTALCERAGLSAGQFDVGDLASITRPVNALAISQVSSTRVVLELLMNTYFFEAVLSDKIYFIARGGSSVVTIAYDDLATVGDSGNASDPLPLLQANDLEVPAQMALSYSNINNDYQADTEVSDRLITGQESVSTIQVPLGFSATEAKAIVDAMLMDKAVSGLTTRVSVGLQYTRLEPTDVIVLTDDDTSTYRMRIAKRTESAGVLTLDCVLDDASVLSQSGVTSEGAGQTTVAALALVDFELLDIPILRDVDDLPGHYVAVKLNSDSANWTSAAIYTSADDLTYTPVTTIADQAVIGRSIGTLATWTGGNVWDEENTVTVTVGSGVLTSATRDEVLNSQSVNAAVLGSEVFQYRTATLVSTGIYTLSGLLRGRRGTEWAVSTHADEDVFVALSTSGLRFIPLQTSDLGHAFYYKAPSAGQRLSSVDAQTLTPMGVGLECFSPVDARANRVSTDTVITWIRRTRLSTSLVGATAISAPLGEDTEAYEVDVYSSSGFATVLRTITATSATCTYTLAQQTTDFGSGQSTLYVKIYQMSALTGRGYALTATI